MSKYQYIVLTEMPSIKDEAAEWFHSKWRIPKEAYLERMEAFLNGETDFGWYLCLDGDRIAAGLGVIENDFMTEKIYPPMFVLYTQRKPIAATELQVIF